MVRSMPRNKTNNLKKEILFFKEIKTWIIKIITKY